MMGTLVCQTAVSQCHLTGLAVFPLDLSLSLSLPQNKPLPVLSAPTQLQQTDKGWPIEEISPADLISWLQCQLTTPFDMCAAVVDFGECRTHAHALEVDNMDTCSGG